eukprot:scaffold426_cov219-Amphora_coffeaeformis.AAC.26
MSAELPSHSSGRFAFSPSLRASFLRSQDPIQSSTRIRELVVLGLAIIAIMLYSRAWHGMAWHGMAWHGRSA